MLTAATFRTSEPTALMAGWKLKSVGVSGSDEVSVPAIEDRPAQNAPPVTTAFRVPKTLP